MTEAVFFYCFAALAVAGAILTVTMRNAVHCAISLIASLGGVAGLYLMLHAEFLFAVQIVLYIGGIMVLFLFVIMLLGAERLPQGKVLPWQRPLAIVAAAVLLSEAIYLLTQRVRLMVALPDPGTLENSMETLREMAALLFTEYLLPFEVTSILLLAAMIGAIVLTKGEKGEPA